MTVSDVLPEFGLLSGYRVIMIGLSVAAPFAEWTATDGTTSIPGVKVVPEVAGHPGRVWRGVPTVGMDNDRILTELGIPDQVRDEMYTQNLLTRREYFENTGS